MSGLTKLIVNVFQAGFVLPLWTAEDKGFYRTEGLQIDFVGTPNSIEQMGGLIDGKYDIAMTAIDNVVAYMEGQGEAKTKAVPDIAAVMGMDSGFLSLMAAPEITSVADFKGRTLAVDAMTTGYSYTLRRMLKVAGLHEDDYTLVAVGGMKERFATLLAGEQAGTFSVPPYTIMAKQKGFKALATPRGMFKHFQGGTAAVRREWAASHGAEIEGFIRGTRAALNWLHEPANRPEAFRIFLNHLPTTTPEVAAQSCEVLLDPATGFRKDTLLDIQGVRVVIDIRQEFHQPYKALGAPEKYFDLSFQERAGV